MGGEHIKTILTDNERIKVLTLKKAARYETKKSTKKTYRYRVSKLAKAWMLYLDLLGVKTYKPRHFNPEREQPTYPDRLFTTGEISAITRFLKKKKLIEDDGWHRHRILWRKHSQE